MEKIVSATKITISLVVNQLSVLNRMKFKSLTNISNNKVYQYQNFEVLEKLVSMVPHFWLDYHVENKMRSKTFH